MHAPASSLERAPAGALRLRDALLLILFCLFAFVPGIAALPPVDRDEARFVQATKQMAETGDYIDIRLQEESRYKKPAGIYWLQSAAVIASGQGADAPIWVYRSVSVAAGIAAVLAMAWLAASLFGSQAGLVAGVALGGLLVVGFEARIAKTDATLLAAALVAQGTLARLYVAHRWRQRVPAALPWAFWIAQGVGMLIKGPVLAGLTLATIAALVVADRDRAWLKSLRALPGLALAVLISAPWLALITWKSGAAFWQESVGQDFLGKIGTGQESHGFPPGYYFLLAPAMLWPFAGTAIGAGVAALTRLGTDPRLRFLCAWYVPWWLLVELIPTKLPHYMLPAYPALIAGLAWAVTDPSARAIAVSGWKLWLHRGAILGTALVTLALAAVAAGAVPYVVGGVSVAGIVAALLMLVAGWLALGRPAIHRLVGAGVAASVALGLLASFVLPALKPVWLSPRIAEAFHRLKPCADSRLATAGYHEPSLVFLAGTRTLLTDGAGAAAALAADPACTIASVDQGSTEAFLAALGPMRDRVGAVAAVEGVNYSNGRRLTLTLYKVK